MDQSVTRRSMGSLELHGQGPEAAFGGALKSLTVLQQSPVQMEADVCLKTLWEAFQHLRDEGIRWGREQVREGENDRGG